MDDFFRGLAMMTGGLAKAAKQASLSGGFGTVGGAGTMALMFGGHLPVAIVGTLAVGVFFIGATVGRIADVHLSQRLLKGRHEPRQLPPKEED
jgi:hypothetical protein